MARKRCEVSDVLEAPRNVARSGPNDHLRERALKLRNFLRSGRAVSHKGEAHTSRGMKKTSCGLRAPGIPVRLEHKGAQRRAANAYVSHDLVRL